MALTLDPITVNTELAEEYMKKYNNFDAWPELGKFWLVTKYPDDKKEYDIKSPYNATATNSHVDTYTRRNLAEEIKKYESTFYQLEYLIRKTDKADFQNYFLLMCQHLQCDDDSWNSGYVDQINILMNDNTPLYVLGCAAANTSNLKLSIVTTQKIAPICYLFARICAHVGWQINLVFITDVNDYFDVIKGTASNVFVENTAYLACTGVVTESADIDSALDTFINSSVAAPWKLQRIYVQESVYDEVKEALEAKCSREAVPSCAEAFAARGKILVCDALGAAGGAAHVPVEAYRTAGELAGLLRRRPAPALSLWAADSQLAHALALEAPATVVWLNEYASFHGPPSSSLPVYEPLYSDFEYDFNEELLKDLANRWTHWNKMSKNERLASVLNTLQSVAPEDYDSVDDLRNDILNVRDASWVDVDDGKICFCVERPSLFHDFIDLYFVSKLSLAICINALVNGMAIVYGDYSVDPETKNVLKSLSDANSPVTYISDSSPLSVVLQKTLSFKKLKVIRSNFGTIFAN